MDSFYSNRPEEESPELVCPNCGMAVMGKDNYCIGCGMIVTPVDRKTYERTHPKENTSGGGAKDAAGNGGNTVNSRLEKLEDRFVGPNKNILYLRDDEEIGKEEDEDEYGKQPIPDSRLQKEPIPINYILIGVIAVIILIVIISVLLNI